MTRLDCSVTSCLYNENNYCSRGDITIGGKNAACPGDTCCESFHKRGTGTGTNSISHPSANIEVDCEAKECKFNANCKCSANHIGIAGRNASECKETECASFCIK